MSIVHQVAHGSADWLRVRAGIPTSSRFSEIVQPVPKVNKETGKTELLLSKSSSKYMAWLLVEWILGRPLDKSLDSEGRPNEMQSRWMTRGLELEEDAVRAYELQADVETRHVGFITTDDGMIGASPDRLIGSKKGLELKCPSPQIHMQYLLMKGVDDEYKTQLQGQMLVGELEEVDIFSYHPELPCVIINVKREEEYIRNLEKPIRLFVEQMLQKRVELEQRFGPFVRPEPPEEDLDGYLSAADVEEHIARLNEAGVL